MRYSLSRKDYNELMILGHGEMHFGLRSEDVPNGEQQRYLDEAYPTSTEGASSELRTRGLDARPAVLEYLIKKGVIPVPRGEGRNRQWSAADIDRVADYMDREGMFTPGGITCMYLNIDPGQDIRARRKAFRENPHIVPDSSLFVMELMPGAPGAGIYATVSYRPMTRDEQAEWNRKVKAAKKVQE